jgi:hypothetical protein
MIFYTYFKTAFMPAGKVPHDWVRILILKINFELLPKFSKTSNVAKLIQCTVRVPYKIDTNLMYNIYFVLIYR